MTTINIAFALLVIALAYTVYRLGRNQSGGDSKIAGLMRDILIARAEGRISAEEFEQRQESLRAALLQPSADSGWRKHMWLAPIFLAALVVTAYEFAPTPQNVSGPESAPAGLPPSPHAGDDLQNIASMLNNKLTRSGSPGSMPIAGDATSTGNTAPAAPAGDLREMAQRLAGKLAKNPKDGGGWTLLAQSYRELKQFREADEAFTKAADLLPPDATMLADWADAHVSANNRKWDSKGHELVKRALLADARHLKALALAGSEAFESGNYKQAVEYWTRMKTYAPQGSMEAREAEVNLNEARARQPGKN